MVRERNNIKKWRSSWTKTLVVLHLSARPRSQVHPCGKDLFTLNYLFYQCGSFFSTLDNLFYQISSCKQLNSKEQTWQLKMHSIMFQFTTFNVRAILSVPDSAAFCVLSAPFYLCSPQSSMSRDHPQVAVVERYQLRRGGR